MVASSVRRFHLALLVAFLALLVRAVPSYAKCDPTADPDKTDIANARAAIATNCDCAGATTHGAYVSCAVQQANLVLVNPSCKGAVKKCAAHSTCGKPTAVTCCLTTTKGTKCKIKKDAAHCTAKQGTVGSCTSCCDACPAPGSGPSCPAPTTTTSTTSTTTTTTTTTTSTTMGCSCPVGQSPCTEQCGDTNVFRGCQFDPNTCVNACLQNCARDCASHGGCLGATCGAPCP